MHAFVLYLTVVPLLKGGILGFPAITPRDAIERPEGLDAGCIFMTGLNAETILDCVHAATQLFEERAKQGHAHHTN